MMDNMHQAPLQLNAFVRGYVKRMRLLFLTLVAIPFFAQSSPSNYPNKPIRIVVPYAAGGPMDFIGRTLGQKMGESLGHNFIIDNRPGAGGAIGSKTVAQSAPDGYTILLTSSSHASLPVTTKSLPYDAVQDFVPITMVAKSVGFIMAASSHMQMSNVQELVAYAKKNPGELNYGSGGIGNIMQFAAEYFNNAAGVAITHVPYKGVGQAINDLAAGRIDICFASAPALLPFIKSGRIKALAVTAAERWSELPKVPTLAESGLDGFLFVPWYGLWFPAGTPQEFTDLMQREVVKAFEHADVKQAFAAQGFVPVASPSAQFAEIIVKEIELNRILAAKINLTPQ